MSGMQPEPSNLQAVTTETSFLLPGPAGDLEILLSPASSLAAKQRIAVICHPHPLYGGTMHNKVVTTLSKAFQKVDMQTLRFNFRGVGQSQGQYREGEGELQDLYAILAWLKKATPEAAIWLAGFSFGAFISIRAAMEEKGIEGLVSVAPPVNHFSLKGPVKIACPWIVVQGDRDEVVPLEAVLSWVEGLNPKPRLIRFPQAGHFFHGGLTELKEALIVELKAML